MVKLDLISGDSRNSGLDEIDINEIIFPGSFCSTS